MMVTSKAHGRTKLALHYAAAAHVLWCGGSPLHSTLHACDDLSNDINEIPLQFKIEMLLSFE